MKKALFISALLMLTVAGRSFGQTVVKAELSGGGETAKEGHKEWIEIPSTSWGASNAGTQTVQLPNARGTLKFTRNGDKFSNMVFTDAAGKIHRLQPTQPGTGGLPQPSCKYPLPDACFGTADKNIGLCICKPTDITNGEGYVLAMLLPAVQKVREAAQN